MFRCVSVGHTATGTVPYPRTSSETPSSTELVDSERPAPETGAGSQHIPEYGTSDQRILSFADEGGI